MLLGLKILWAKRVTDGFEYGAAYAPVIPGSECLLENYVHRVLNRPRPRQRFLP